MRVFGHEHGKGRAERHGEVTEEYITYNRRDVRYFGVSREITREYAKHPITLQVTKANPPASIGKAYLRVMGIKPILERQPKFPKGIWLCAVLVFWRTNQSHIRKVAIPVVYTDFLSCILWLAAP